MAKGPGGVEGGRVSIRVVPDSTGFRQKLKAELEKAVAGIKIEIPIEVKDLGEIRRQVKAATQGLKAEVKVEAKTAKARAELETLERNYRGELTVKTNVDTVIGKIMALRALTRENLRAKVIYNDAPLAKASYRVFYLWAQWRRLLTLLRSYAIFMTYLSAALMPPLFSLSIETLTAGAGLIAAAAGMLSAVGSLAVGGIFTFIAWKSEEVQETWKGVKENIRGAFDEMNKPVADALVRNLPLLENAIEIMRPNIEHVAQGVSEVIDKLGKQLPDIASAAGDMMERMWDSGRRNLEAFIDAIPGLLSGIGDFFQIIGESDSIHRAWTDFLRNLPNWMGSWGRGLDNVAKFFYRMRDYLQSDQLQKYSQGLKDFVQHMKDADFSRWKEGITDMLNAFGTFLSDTNWQAWFDFFGKLFTMISKLSDHLSAVGPLGAIATYAAARMGAAFVWGLGSELMAMGTRKIGRMVFGSAANVREHGIIKGATMGRGFRDGMDKQTKRMQVQTESRMKRMSNNMANTFRAGIGAAALGGANMFGVMGKAGDAGRGSVGITKFTEETKKAGQAAKGATPRIYGIPPAFKQAGNAAHKASEDVKKASPVITTLGNDVEKAGGKISRTATTAAKYGGIAALFGFLDPLVEGVFGLEEWSFLGQVEDTLYGVGRGLKNIGEGIFGGGLTQALGGLGDAFGSLITLGHWDPGFTKTADEAKTAAQSVDDLVESYKSEKFAMEQITGGDWTHLFSGVTAEDMPNIVQLMLDDLGSWGEVQRVLYEMESEYSNILNSMMGRTHQFTEGWKNLVPLDTAAVTTERIEELAAKVREGKITIREAMNEIMEAMTVNTEGPVKSIEQMITMMQRLGLEVPNTQLLRAAMLNLFEGTGEKMVADLGIAADSLPPILTAMLQTVESEGGNVRAALEAIADGTMESFMVNTEYLPLHIREQMDGVAQALWSADPEIRAAAQAALAGLPEAVTEGTNNAKTAAETGTSGISSIFSNAFGGISPKVAFAMLAISQAVKGKTDEMKSSVTTAFPEMETTMTGAMEGAETGSTASMTALAQAIGEKVRESIDSVRPMPPEIEGIVNQPGLLSAAGDAIMDGFVTAMMSKWNARKGELAAITSEIPELKGPYERDKVLLVPAGNAVMDGFHEGILQGWGRVQETLHGITNQLGTAFTEGGLPALAEEGAAVAATAGNDVAQSFLDAFDEAFERRGWSGVSDKLVEAFDLEELGKDVAGEWGSQFMSDLGLSGNGVLGRLMSNPDDLGKVQTLVFHVNNLDEALEIERRKRREEADEMSELR